MPIRMKRVYEPASPDDGYRVLVDRLWPRGLSKETAGLDEWTREIAPSNELRKWYAHDPAKWDAFRERYFAELTAHADTLQALRERATTGTVTLLFSSKETRYNNAAALKEYLEQGD